MARNPTDERILRDVMIRELETIQEYDRMIERAENADVRRFLAHAITEEKEHVAEAMQLLGQLDPMQREAIEEDHSAHFRAGGPGDAALREIEGHGNDAGGSAGEAALAARGDSLADARTGDAGPVADAETVGSAAGESAAGESTAGDSAAGDALADEIATGGMNGHADESPFPWIMAPDANLSEATVGAMRGDP